MKKLIVVFMVMVAGVTVTAQNKNAKAAFQVNGVCGMCKDRIEDAAIRTKGVKMATWDVHTHYLSVIYDERKTDLENIHKSVAAVGHDTKEITATEEAYNSVDQCCRYRDENVIKAHGDGGED